MSQLSLCLDVLKVQLSLLATTRNAKLNLILLVASLYLSKSQSLWWLALQPTVVFFFNLTERFFGLTIWSREDGSKISYDLVRFIPSNPYGKGLDLGFNFYDEDYSKSPSQAQLDKFNHAWDKLQLKEGMRILDCGCGMGDWLYWLKNEKKCSVVGINMTFSHVMVCRNRGLQCLHTDWQSFFADKDAFSKLQGQFDVVTFWDTVEHYCKVSEITVWNGFRRDVGVPASTTTGKNEQVAKDVYGSMFQMAQGLIDPSSKCGRVWISCLHQTHSWKEESLYGISQVYMMTTYYDGIYPWLDDGLSKYAGEGLFDLVHVEDRTEDYRMTSVINRDHFGYLKHSLSPAAILVSLLSIVTTPQSMIVHIDFLRSALGFETAWMWHLGGIKEEPAKDAIAKLLWQVYRVKESQNEVKKE